MDTNTPKPLKSIEIFRPGTFTAANGQRYSFSPAQVKEMAETYNPAFSDAPFVVGHPKMTSPRFGRAGSLFVNDAGVLCAEPADVVPEFAAAVNARQYPKVSASIFLPGAPGNPTPGKHYLRHVGFLGGVAPAVKGLEMVEFASSQEGIVDFSYEDRAMVGLFRSMRDWLIETLGLEKAQQIIPDYTLSSLEASVTLSDAEDSIEGITPAFSDPNQPTEAELSQQEALLAQEKKNQEVAEGLTARELALAEKEAKIGEAAIANFAEVLCTEGKLLPAQAPQIVEIMKQLESVNLVADFAAGDENHGKTGAELFKAFLSAQPKMVEFARISKPGDAADTATVDFASPPGAEVDQEGLLLLGRAQQYQRENPGVDIVAAAKAVSGT